MWSGVAVLSSIVWTSHPLTAGEELFISTRRRGSVTPSTSDPSGAGCDSNSFSDHSAHGVGSVTVSISGGGGGDEVRVKPVVSGSHIVPQFLMGVPHSSVDVGDDDSLSSESSIPGGGGVDFVETPGTTGGVVSFTGEIGKWIGGNWEGNVDGVRDVGDDGKGCTDGGEEEGGDVVAEQLVLDPVVSAGGKGWLPDEGDGGEELEEGEEIRDSLERGPDHTHSKRERERKTYLGHIDEGVGHIGGLVGEALEEVENGGGRLVVGRGTKSGQEFWDGGLELEFDGGAGSSSDVGRDGAGSGWEWETGAQTGGQGSGEEEERQEGLHGGGVVLGVGGLTCRRR